MRDRHGRIDTLIEKFENAMVSNVSFAGICRAGARDPGECGRCELFFLCEVVEGYETAVFAVFPVPWDHVCKLLEGIC